MNTKITFTREYEGGYGVRVDGRIVGYIDSALIAGGGWFDINGQRHRYLSEAKASSEFALA